MSAPTRALVTIDDPITIIEEHRVLLEWVEEVRRDDFIVRSVAVNGATYRHDQEGVTWARGHHLPDSEVVVSLRAAASLVVREAPGPTGATGPIGRTGPPGPPGLPVYPTPAPFTYADLLKEADRWTRENERDATRPAWWKTILGITQP